MIHLHIVTPQGLVAVSVPQGALLAKVEAALAARFPQPLRERSAQFITRAEYARTTLKLDLPAHEVL